MGEERQRFEEIFPDMDVQADGAEAGAEGAPDADEPSKADVRIQKLANENRDLRDRLMRLEGAVSTKPTPAPEAEPEFDTEEERYLYRLTRHTEALTKKIAGIEAAQSAKDAAAKRLAVIRQGVRGIKFSDPSFAKESLELWVERHPKADADEVRAYAQRLHSVMGGDSAGGATYAQQKKADQVATRRPSRSVQPAAPAGEKVEKPKTFQEARAAAMKRINAARAAR